MGHNNYIVSSTPYLVISRRPIYKVPTATLKINPYHWKPGKINVVEEWPFNGMELEDTITTPTQGTRNQVVDSEIAKILAEWVVDDNRIV